MSRRVSPVSPRTTCSDAPHSPHSAFWPTSASMSDVHVDVAVGTQGVDVLFDALQGKLLAHEFPQRVVFLRHAHSSTRGSGRDGAADRAAAPGAESLTPVRRRSSRFAMTRPRPRPTTIPCFDLGLVEYGPVQRLQIELQQAVADEIVPGVLLLLEHPPVVTLGSRGTPGRPGGSDTGRTGPRPRCR